MAEQKTAESRMQKAVDRLVTDYSEIRAGRANPNVLDKVMVDYYGTPTPINQVADHEGHPGLRHRHQPAE